LGLFGRRPRPLIFSTELSCSTRERESREVLEKIARLRQQLTQAATVEKLRELLTVYDTQVQELEKRNVTVYGAINLRTDGQKVVLAYKLEEKRQNRNTLTEWDLYRLEPDAAGQLVFVNQN